MKSKGKSRLNKKLMKKFIDVTDIKDIPEDYRETPIELLLRYHNLGEPFAVYEKAQVLIGMCMDNRKSIILPDNFAFIIRTGGSNLRYSEFKVSFAISVGGVKHIALIGHNNCGMVNLMAKKKLFVEGLVESAGWDKQLADEHFMHYAPLFEIGNETDFILSEVKRLRLRYPTIMVAPLHYNVLDNRLSFIIE